ncbi:MAG: 50S ribosomal protein L19e [archaeon]
MNLAKRKELAAKVFGVGKGRIIFVKDNLPEIKEAITRMDIIDLHKSGAIKIREIRGRKKIVRRRHRRRVGKVKGKVSDKKAEYVIITRKLRKFVRGLVRAGKIKRERSGEIRKEIRARKFKSKRHLKEILEEGE